MTARTAKVKAKPVTITKEDINDMFQRARVLAAENGDQTLRSQCLALACSMASEGDGHEDIIRAARSCFDWIKNATVPQKPNIRAV